MDQNAEASQKNRPSLAVKQTYLMPNSDQDDRLLQQQNLENFSQVDLPAAELCYIPVTISYLLD